MIESNPLHLARPALPLILLGVLKGYVNNPLSVLARTFFNMRRIKKRIPGGLPADLVAMTALVGSLYEVLKMQMDKERALAVVTASILPAGLATQLGNFRFVEETRSFVNLIANQQRTNREGPTRLNTMEVVKADESSYEFRVHRCIFMEVFSGLGVPELTRVICSIDNAIFNTYLPEEIIFHRNGIGHRIADHAPFCEFHCTHLVSESR
ncbi:MAG: hypothetical protein CVU54_06855 [Deltaproteobacteria bacterium HGW-Deltaproteobacteria-12]|nr:MAG: hypothetical protein CVU54_06855 [Deltaproteobacteria bacterium HGW-Deltaproteobacteria-12]